MTQSRKRSFIEALINLIIGFIISVASQFVIYTHLGLGEGRAVAWGAGTTLYFTTISLIRTYTLRRLFNRGDEKQ